MNPQLPLFDRPAWQRTHKGDVRCRELADRHYTRQKPGHPMWTRPGYNFVLFLQTELGRAVWCWWRPKWEAGQERFDGLRAIECTIFRNENSGIPSSALIVMAVGMLRTDDAKRDLNLDAPHLLTLITGVSSEKTRRRRSKRSLPGECFRRAGWREFDHKKGRADVWLELPT